MNANDLDRKKLPRHVAIIMDGNGRWAKKHGVTRARGHEAGTKSVREVVEACRELGAVESLSLYAFSTENWKRSKREVNTLFRLLSRYINIEIDNLHKEGIRVLFTGRKDGLSKRVLDDMERSTEMTKDNPAMTLNLAVNYGGRSELVDATRAIVAKVQAGDLDSEAIDEQCISDHLYLPSVQDLDLLIRTSGELRLSNFMLWQASYSEIVVTETLWPDFRKPDLHQAFKEYESRSRRFGRRR